MLSSKILNSLQPVIQCFRIYFIRAFYRQKNNNASSGKDTLNQIPGITLEPENLNL
jgi:hypothetical protein